MRVWSNVRPIDSFASVARVAGFRFFFFSNESREPPHIHVERRECVAKFWLVPPALASNLGFRSSELGELHRLVRQHQALFKERWDEYFRRLIRSLGAVDVHCSEDALNVRLSDGRELSVPLEWFPRLRDASPAARAEYRLVGGGIGIHWPQLDEDLSVAGLLAVR